MSLGTIATPRPFATLEKWEQHLTALKSLPPETPGLPASRDVMIKLAERRISQMKRTQGRQKDSGKDAA